MERLFISVKSYRAVNLYLMNIEIFAGAEQCFLESVYLDRLTLRLCIVFRRAKLCNIDSLFNVEFSGLAVLAYSAVVIYSVCRIAVLLNFGDKYTLADSVVCLNRSRTHRPYQRERCL